MSDTSPPPTASKRAASPFSPESGTAPKRAREGSAEGKTESPVHEGEGIKIEQEESKDKTKNGNGIGEVKKMEDAPMEGWVIL